MLTSLTYVSHSNFAEGDCGDSVKAILRESKLNNAARGITGVLVFTGDHFFQIVEGERSSLDLLASKLESDPRHHSFTIIENVSVPSRRFCDWSMGYVGPSVFATRHIRRLLADPSPTEAKRAAEWLSTLMLDKARAS